MKDAPPPPASKFFQFHAVFGRIWQNCVFMPPPPWRVHAPPLGKSWIHQLHNLMFRARSPSHDAMGHGSPFNLPRCLSVLPHTPLRVCLHQAVINYHREVAPNIIGNISGLLIYTKYQRQCQCKGIFRSDITDSNSNASLGVNGPSALTSIGNCLKDFLVCFFKFSVGC